MIDVVDINLTAASTAEFLRQVGRLADLPRFWWYRYRGYHWIVEQGIPAQPSLELCPFDQVPNAIAEQVRDEWHAVESEFHEFRFVRADAIKVEAALAAVAVARDGRSMCQISRVDIGRAVWLSAGFTSVRTDGTVLVTGNSRHYWDSPPSVRTQHLPGKSIHQVAARHRNWLARHSSSVLVRHTAEDALSVIQHVSRLLAESYIRRGLYIVRPAAASVAPELSHGG